jgi:predicted secreted hydrolase
VTVRGALPPVLALALALGGCAAAERPVPEPPPTADRAGRDEGWERARPGWAWEFPRDHAAHRRFRIEWWYLTGLLRAVDDPGRAFGYQFTVFRVGVLPRRPALASAWTTDTLLLGHAAVTDVAGNGHRFSEVLHREVPLLAGFGAPGEPVLAWTRAPPGTDGVWRVAWNGDGFDVEVADTSRGMAYALTTRATRPLVLHGDGGLSAKSTDGRSASLYYSYTRLATEGTVTLDGRTWRVSGTSWMDKEFSTSSLGRDQAGWDWFALRLADGRDLMLYVLRAADGTVDTAHGTLVLPDGTTRALAAPDFSLRPTARWRNPSGTAVYPSRWTLAVPAHGIDLDVVPLVADQENRAALPGAPDYWEGAVRALDRSGREAGEGYVELTGYGEGGRPPV